MAALSSIPGVSEEAFERMSDRQKQRLSEEVNAGKKAQQNYQKTAEENRKLTEAAAGDVQAPAADELLSRQDEERKEKAEYADKAQEQAAKANADKAIFDQMEAIGERRAVHPSLVEPLKQPTEDLVKQRREQSVENNEASSTEMSDAQKAASFANAQKEIADRVGPGAASGGEAGVFVGSISPISVETPVFDAEGKELGRYSETGEWVPNKDYEASIAVAEQSAAGGGVKLDTSTDAADLVAAALGDAQPKRGRGRPPKNTTDRAVGDGPTSE